MMAATFPPLSATDENPSRFAQLGARLWHRLAPKRVSGHCRPGAAGEGWEAWREYLKNRKEPLPPAKLLDYSSWPLAWALPDETLDSGTADWIDLLAPAATRKKRIAPAAVEAIEPWLIEAAQTPAGVGYALEALAVAYALPRLSEQLAPELWWALLEHLVQTAREADAPLSAKPLTGQLLGGELPLALAYLFPEILPCRELAEPAKKNLSAGLVELLDGEGLPHGGHLHLLRPLLACWTRAAALGEKLKGGAFDREATTQYEWLVRQAIRFSRHDGSQVFAQGAADAWEPDLFAAAVELGGNDEDQAAARVGLPKSKASGGRKPPAHLEHDFAAEDLPEPSAGSEWSGLAMLRPYWPKKNARLAVDYSSPRMRIELDMKAGVVLSGQWECRVEIDGKPLEPTGDWEELCWNSDDEGDYLELEIALDENVRLQRQILFPRDDDFLYLCDVVLGKEAKPLDYRAVLPLAPGAAFLGAEETREGLLQIEASGKPVGQVLPLALPEWRVERRVGELTASVNALELRQRATGRNLACPLFIDLAPRRMKKELTWRQLTVAEHLEVQPAEVAVGYRVQCGREQWLFYRSLAEPANRSVLGQNLTSEFLAARFDTGGDVEELIEIEGPEE